MLKHEAQMMSRLIRLLGTRRMSAAANPQARRSILEETIGARLSRQDLVSRCARLHPTISAGTVDAIETLTGSWSAEVDSFLEISKSQPPLVSESHPALSQTFNSPIPPTRFQSTATLSHPVPAEPARATSVSDSQLSPAAFAELLTPVVSALESGNNKLSDQWVASTASLFGLRGPHASSMAIALVSNITHFTQRTWPLMLPFAKQPCEPSAFTQISLTAHEYMHHSLPRWRAVWKTVLQGYWPISGSPEPSQDRREDLMLALVAFLLQRLPALGDFPANPKPVLPVSIPAHVQQCSQAKSLGGSFSHSLGPLTDASSEARARRVLDIWSRACLIRVSPDGLGWTGASPVAEEALFREIDQRFDDMLKWMLDESRPAVWLDSALQLSVMFARFHESTHEGPYPTTKIHSFDPLRRLPPSGHAEALVPITGSQAASWLSRAVTSRCVDGRAADGAEYKLLWRRIQRLQWPHLLQVFARQQPLQLEREVLYVLPPRSAYPVYLLLNESDEMILISASMMDYATSEQHVEFAFRLHRPLNHLVRWVPPHMGAIDSDSCVLSMYGHSPSSQGLPTLGELLKHITASHLRGRRSRVVLNLRHLHLTPSTTITTLDADLPNVHAANPATLLGPNRAQLINTAYSRWAKSVGVPREVIVSPLQSIDMLRSSAL